MFAKGGFAETIDPPSIGHTFVDLKKGSLYVVLLQLTFGSPAPPKLQFLGPRGPLVLPLAFIQTYMPHESSDDSSNQPDGPMHPAQKLTKKMCRS